MTTYTSVYDVIATSQSKLALAAALTGIAFDLSIANLIGLTTDPPSVVATVLGARVTITQHSTPSQIVPPSQVAPILQDFYTATIACDLATPCTAQPVVVT